MDRIIAITDFEKSDRAAIRYALRLFRFSNPELVLLNVFSNPNSFNEMMVSIGDLQEFESRRKLKIEVDYCKDHFPDYREKIDFTTSNTSVSSALVDLRVNDEEDCIVTICREANGNDLQLNHFGDLLHSNAQLLILPPDIKFKVPNRVVYASELDLLKYTKLEFLVKLVLHYNAELSSSKAWFSEIKQAVKNNKQIEISKDLIDKESSSQLDLLVLSKEEYMSCFEGSSSDKNVFNFKLKVPVLFL